MYSILQIQNHKKHKLTHVLAPNVSLLNDVDLILQNNLILINSN
jgi:hypothetical protein